MKKKLAIVPLFFVLLIASPFDEIFIASIFGATLFPVGSTQFFVVIGFLTLLSIVIWKCSKK
jgi:hypothetical protein